MHELGIVFYIMRDVREAALAGGASCVDTVVMDIGEVSTVVPHLLEDCWGWAVSRDDLLRGCKLRVETIPAVTYCEDCGARYPTVAHGKTCPECGSASTYLVQGNEVMIREIIVPDDPPASGEDNPD